ncbi:Cys-tRN [Sesbania bispinosa]|nr:Cys-tRN [Sesbania bispinosa]
MDSSLMGSECNSEDSDVEVLGMRMGSYSSLLEDSDAAQGASDAASSDVGEPEVNVAAADEEQVFVVPAAKKRRLKPEEIRTRNSGVLEGYFIRINSESKEEDEYDFVSFPWVEDLVARTKSIYTGEKPISAFVDSRDVVDGNLPGNVECTWMMEDDGVCSRVPFSDCRTFVRRKRKILIAYAQSFKHFKDHFFRLRSEEGVDSAALSREEKIEVKFLKELPPLRCIKLIRFGDDPVKLKAFMDQMAPKMDKKALMLEMKKQRLASADKGKVGAISFTVAPELSNAGGIQTVAPTSSVAGGRKGGRTEKTSPTLAGQALVDKGVNPGEGLALVQIKHFNPEADISGCDPMKELVNNVLVDLGEGEEDPGSADHGNEEEIVDSQGGEVNKLAEDSDKAGNEEQGDSPLK